jgi:hypothetical protein
MVYTPCYKTFLAMIIHYKGKAITMSDREAYPFLRNKLYNHTECGYLFDNTEENRERLTFDKDKVTCKLCLRKMRVG